MNAPASPIDLNMIPPRQFETLAPLFWDGLLFGLVLMIPIWIAIRLAKTSELAKLLSKNWPGNPGFILGGATHFASAYAVTTAYFTGHVWVLGAIASLLPFWHRLILAPLLVPKRIARMRVSVWGDDEDNFPPLSAANSISPPSRSRSRRPISKSGDSSATAKSRTSPRSTPSKAGKIIPAEKEAKPSRKK